MDNQSNPMGLLAPFVAAFTAALQEMITKAVDEALTARAGAANAAALLDDTLNKRIEDIAQRVIDEAIENHMEYGNHPNTEAIREVIDEYDLDDKFSSVLDNFDFSDAIDKALDNFDISDKVANVINHGSFEFSA